MSLPSSRPASPVVAVLVAVVLALGLVVTPSASAASDRAARADGLSPGPDDDFPRLPQRCYDRETDRVLSPCRLTFEGPHRPWVVVWGDSHAWMYTSAFRDLARRMRVNLLTAYYGSCPVSVPFPPSSGEPHNGCDAHNEAALELIRDLVRSRADVHVVIGGWWANYRRNYALVKRKGRTGQDTGIISYHEHMARLAGERSRPAMRALARLEVPVELIAPAATVPDDARRCASGEDPYQCDLGRSKALPAEYENKRFVRRLAELAGPRSGVVDPSPLYVRDRTVLARVDGVNTFFDQIHLGDRLARRTKPWFRPVFGSASRG